MSPIVKALQDLRFTMPTPILEMAFPNCLGDFYVKSLDSKILDGVIRPRVMVDCNLKSGEIVYLPLAHGTITHANDYAISYQFPDELLQGREIIQAISIMVVNPGQKPSGDNSPTGLLHQMVNSSAAKGLPVEINTLDLVAKNTVLITNIPPNLPMYTLKCTVSHDPELSNLQPGNVPFFSNLVTTAVKSYVYKELQFKLNQGIVLGGVSLDSYSSYLSELSDSENDYQELLKSELGARLFMNNSQSHTNFIKAQVGSWL